MESTNTNIYKQSQLIMTFVAEHKKKTTDLTQRVGLSGPPGAGKSTFIEALGNFVVKEGRKLAVLVCVHVSHWKKGYGCEYFSFVYIFLYIERSFFNLCFK